MQVDEESKNNVLFEPEIYRAEDITTASEAQQSSGQAVSNQKVFDSASQIRCCVCGVMTAPNPALNLAPFVRWTLRDKAAQRRLALRYASCCSRVPFLRKRNLAAKG